MPGNLTALLIGAVV
jgi:hypothetical protein